MLVSFNPSISYKNNKTQCRKQNPAFGQISCQAIFEDGKTIRFTNLPKIDAKSIIGTIRELGDFVTTYSRGKQYAGKILKVRASELDAVFKDKNESFVSAYRDTFLDQGVVID